MNEADVQSLDIEEIIAELDAEYTGKLPERALRAAQRCRTEITPRLIELIRGATVATRAGNPPEGNGHLFAFFLLAEFGAVEALPAIVDMVTLPKEGGYELLGDAMTESLASVLAALAVDSPGVVDDLMADRSLDQFIRWQAAQTFLYWVRDGRMTREEAVDRLRQHLRVAIDNNDEAGASGFVAELVSYAPHEASEVIDEAFRKGVVDTAIVGPRTVEKSIREGETRFQRELEYCRPTGCPDTVKEFKQWASFREPTPTKPEKSDRLPTSWPKTGSTLAPFGDELVGHTSPTTVRNTGQRVGRNEPCPCGSGKKFKKCCGQHG